MRIILNIICLTSCLLMVSCEEREDGKRSSSLDASPNAVDTTMNDTTMNMVDGGLVDSVPATQNMDVMTSPADTELSEEDTGTENLNSEDAETTPSLVDIGVTDFVPDAALDPMDNSESDGPSDTDSDSDEVPTENDANLGGCRGGECGTADDSQGGIDADQTGNGHATNHGESCVTTSKANADLASGKTFINGMNADDAAQQMEECLMLQDCWQNTPGDEGFGPSPSQRNDYEAWDTCFDALCECNNEVIQGESIECRLNRPIFGGSPAVCNQPGSVAFFKIPPGENQRGGIHAVTFEGHSEVQGIHTFEVRDPNCPDSTDLITVDGMWNVDESLMTGVPDNAQLLACFTFR